MSADYDRWVREHIEAQTFHEERNIFEFRWSEMPKIIPQSKTEVVIVTQSTVSRYVPPSRVLSCRISIVIPPCPLLLCAMLLILE